MKSNTQVLFLLGLGLMILYRILVKIPFIQAGFGGFEGAKLLKILIGFVFIVTTFLIYKNSKKQVL